jgi:FKBP-type peptidyl-prolyl cis-trans isomerase
MKITVSLFLCLGLLAVQARAEESQLLKTQNDQLNYSIGVETARKLRKQGVEVDLELLMRGMRDGLSGKELLLSEKLLRKTMNDLQSDLRRRQSQSKRNSGEDNKRLGEAFLAENLRQAGVTALPSGLQYRVLKEGAGARPVDGDTVQCNYRGTLTDGTVFDSSPPGQPATLKVASLVAGWREALKLMPVGSSRRIFIPSQLAYGSRGAGRDIGPNETLIFEVELVAIK